jgi:3-phytase
MFSLREYYSFASVVAAALLASACADPEAQSDSAKMLVGVGTPVPAASETVAVATTKADAADDAEIWADPKDPQRAVIIGTDKQAGLYVYGLDGNIRAFLPEGRLNNVDLRPGFSTPAGERVLIAASDRGRMGAALYLMDPSTLQVKPWGLAPLDLAEPYGLCMAKLGDRFVVIVNGTDGQVRQIAVAAGKDGKPEIVEQRRFGLKTQTEGCVADDARGRLYIGEEAAGVWRFDLDPASKTAGRLVASAPSAQLKPDVEGLTLLHEKDGKSWLIVSSQGDSAFAVWRADGPELAYAGRISIMGANGADPVTGTDGVAALGAPVGNFPAGLMVVQDDSDTDGEAPTAGRDRQNFKLVDWREVRRALRLP